MDDEVTQSDKNSQYLIINSQLRQHVKTESDEIFVPHVHVYCWAQLAWVCLRNTPQIGSASVPRTFFVTMRAEVLGISAGCRT